MMTTRWMIAAAGAIGVGVLTASALLGPTTHVEVLGSDGGSPTAVRGLPVRQAGQPRLHRQGHERRECPPRRLQGQGHPDQLLGDVVPALQGGDSGLHRALQSIQGQGARHPRRVGRRRRRRRCGRLRPSGRSTTRCSSAATKRSCSTPTGRSTAIRQRSSSGGRGHVRQARGAGDEGGVRAGDQGAPVV